MQYRVDYFPDVSAVYVFNAPDERAAEQQADKLITNLNKELGKVKDLIFDTQDFNYTLYPYSE